MPVSDPAHLIEALALKRNRLVSLIGGGGKTSLMFALARGLESSRGTVLTTTSTKILFPDPGQSRRVIVAPFDSSLIARLPGEIAEHRHVTLASAVWTERPADRAAGEKLVGFRPDQIDALAEAGVAGHLLVEADGSAGRSLKAHLDHEPVLSSRAQLVVVVIGVDCVGQPLHERYVHRAALFGQRLGLPPGARLSPEDVAEIVFHPDGYLKRVGGDSSVAVFLSKVGTCEAERTAQDLVEALRRRDREDRVETIVTGELKSDARPPGQPSPGRRHPAG